MAAFAIASAANFELRFCTNKTCSRQGSRQVLQFAKDLALHNVTATSCGCLGSCGAGPNLAIIPLASTDTTANPREPFSFVPLMLHHVSTPAILADILKEVCDSTIDGNVLRATELRLAGNAAATEQDLPRAIALYSQALDLNPAHGTHLLLSNRSAARLASGDAEGALQDASNATQCCPDSFTTAPVREADALYALSRFDASLEALRRGAERHPAWKTTQEYRDLERAIAKAAAAAHSSPKVNVKAWRFSN